MSEVESSDSPTPENTLKSIHSGIKNLSLESLLSDTSSKSIQLENQMTTTNPTEGESSSKSSNEEQVCAETTKSNSIQKKKKYTDEEKMLKFCARGTPYHVEYMLNKNPNLINIKDSDNYTPLHRACYNDNVEVVKLLIERGADIHARTVDGWTPLHCACNWGGLESASVLVNSGANVNAKSQGNVTPLHLAATTRIRGLVELLLHHPDIDVSIVNKGGDTALDIARRNSPFSELFEQINY